MFLLNLYISVICICLGFSPERSRWISISDFKLPGNSLCNSILSSIVCILSAVFSLLSFVLSLVSVVCGLPTAPLHLSRILYKSTLFMQNKPNFRKAKMNVNPYNIKDYQNFIPLAGYKNKPNSNPNKPNFRNAQMNINSLITKDYRKNDDFIVRINKPNSNPISSKPKMSANVYIIEDYENVTAFRPQKNKPKQTQFPKGQNEIKIACQKICTISTNPKKILTIPKGTIRIILLDKLTISGSC